MGTRSSSVAPKKAADDEAKLYTATMAKVGQRSAAKAAVRPRKPKANTRLNKTGFVIYIDPHVNKLLRRTALELDTSAHALGLVGLRLLFDELAIEMPADLLADDPAVLEIARNRVRLSQPAKV